MNVLSLKTTQPLFLAPRWTQQRPLAVDNRAAAVAARHDAAAVIEAPGSPSAAS